MFIWLFGIATFVALVLSLCVKSRRSSLYIQAISCLLEAIYDFLISAVTGGVLNIFNFIRSFFFAERKRFGRKFYVGLLMLFELIVVVNCILTWRGFVSLLPTIGSLIRTYCLWQSSMTLIRFSGVTTGLTYSAYYAIYGGWPLMIGYLLVLVVGFVEFFGKDVNLFSAESANSVKRKG